MNSDIREETKKYMLRLSESNLMASVGFKVLSRANFERELDNGLNRVPEKRSRGFDQLVEDFKGNYRHILVPGRKALPRYIQNAGNKLPKFNLREK